MAEEDFIGRGWGFPPSFDKRSAQVEMLEGKVDIDSSLHVLLSTTIGERIMRPRYGCNLFRFVFEPADSSMQFRVRKIVEDAILYFEPRIRLESVEVAAAPLEGRLEISVNYTIKSTLARGSFVYPFYLNEQQRSASAPPSPEAAEAAGLAKS